MSNMIHLRQQFRDTSGTPRPRTHTRRLGGLIAIIRMPSPSISTPAFANGAIPKGISTGPTIAFEERVWIVVETEPWWVPLLALVDAGLDVPVAPACAMKSVKEESWVGRADMGTKNERKGGGKGRRGSCTHGCQSVTAVKSLAVAGTVRGRNAADGCDREEGRGDFHGLSEVEYCVGS